MKKKLTQYKRRLKFMSLQTPLLLFLSLSHYCKSTFHPILGNKTSGAYCKKLCTFVTHRELLTHFAFKEKNILLKELA